MPFDIENLSSMQIDVLREIGTIGAGNAASSLAALLGKKVGMEVPKVRLIPFDDLSTLLGNAEDIVIAVMQNFTGAMSGSIMFFLKIDEAKSLLEMLNLKGEQNGEEIFNEIEISAITEVGNILSSSFVGALSLLSKLQIRPSVPSICIDMAAALLSVPAIEYGKIGDSVIYIETMFTNGKEKVAGDFFLVPSITSFDILMKALGVE